MHLENDAEWEALIGKGIVSFGRIEVLSVKFLDHFLSKDIDRSALRQAFSRRADQVIARLEAHGMPNPDELGLLDGFRQAKALVETRNLIAHNPVMLDLYAREGSHDLVAERSIRSIRPNEKTLDLAELREFAEQVENLAADLWCHYLRIVGSAEPLWRRFHGPIADAE